MRITSLRQGSANRLFRLEQRPGPILSSAPEFVNLPWQGRAAAKRRGADPINRRKALLQPNCRRAFSIPLHFWNRYAILALVET